MIEDIVIDKKVSSNTKISSQSTDIIENHYGVDQQILSK